MFRNLCLSAILMISCGLVAQDKPLPPAPSEKSTTIADYSQEALVFEKLLTVYHFENDGKGFRRQTGRVRVQSEAALQSLGQLVFAYSSGTEKMKVNYVRVIKADGSIVNAGESNIQDMTTPVAREAPVYSDLREKHITVPALRPGEVLEYEIETAYTEPLAPGQFWMDHVFEKNSIVMNETLELNIPAGRKLQLKTQPGFDPKIAEADGRKVYTWTNQHLAREEKKKKGEKPKKPFDRADVAATTFTSWDELAQWYAGLEKDRHKVTPELSAKAQELTKGLTTEREKAQAIYDYVAKNFRYVSLSFGVGRFQPHAASDIYANLYGDCKDKHTLLSTMLASVNIPADTLLIHSQRKLDRDTPSPSQFDHVITAVHLGKDRVIVDTTSEIAPFGALLSVIRHKDGVLITPAGKAEIVTTPTDWPMPTMQKVEIEGKVTELGKLERSVKYTTRGDLELGLRSIFRRVPQTGWEDVVQRVAYMDGMIGDVKDVKISDVNDTTKAFELSFTLTTPNFLDFSSKKSKFGIPLPLTRLPDIDADDTDPVQLGGVGAIDTSLRITVPEKFKLSIPLPVTMKREYAEYQSAYKWDKGTLTVTRKLNILVPEVLPAQAGSLDAFRNVVARDAGQEIGVETDEVAASAATKGADEDELYDAAVAAYRNRNYKLSAQLYEKVVELNPKHKTAWTYLGQSYMEQSQYDKAEKAYKKQVELNPYDEVVYNDLGLLYERMHKYEESGAQFRKQLEINPLDQYAHRSLGLMLSRRHKYEEAIPELEQALSITSDDVFTRQQLGDAYLKTGKTDKALEEFDKVVKDSPTPIMWNNVAYALAEHKQSLDRAQKYAESAIAMTVASLNNLPMDQLLEEGAGLTNSLASYWDTLGWIYFQQGKMDEAEKYIRASWDISQGGEVGDHLAQIYEKRGMKDKAIDMYAEAISSNSPVPETRDRLAKLVGEKKVDSIVEAKRSKLVGERNVVLGKGAVDGFAEFHIVQRGPAVENVKFSKGSAGLKDFGDKLKGLKYPGLASASDTRLYRRGIVSCSKAKCDLVLVPTVFAFDGATDVPADLQGLFDHVSEQKDAPNPK